MSQNDKRILIVDDTPTNIRVLVPILMEYSNYQINIANNGHDALKLLEKVQPDLILLDIMMPKLNGFDTCKIIKENPALKHIPIIFLTAKNEPEDLAKGFELGAADFVSKPFNSVELISRVKTHIELKTNRDLLKTRLEKLVQERTEQLEKEIIAKLKLKDQLMQSQKMEAIGQLAGGVAHDFNNQLGGIIGSAELIKYNTDNEKILKYVGMILNAAQSSANLTKQLLAFARKGKETSMPVDINKTIRQISQLLTRSIDKKINIKHDFIDNNTFTTGDQAQLENAMLNIAINAAHAMLDGGTLTFHTEVIELDGDEFSKLNIEQRNCIKICISDTGTGMPQEILEKIFDPFFTTKGKDKGTGLGLSATYGAIEQHKGHISVDSVIDEGTTFTILLPESLEQIATKTNVPIANIESTRILLIDDEPIILFTVSETLKELGCEITTAEDGPTGIEIFTRDPDAFDIIILDKIMPHMNGFEVFKKLKEIKPDVKAILSSGYSNEQAQEILNYGVKAFIRKPYTMATLANVLAEQIK